MKQNLKNAFKSFAIELPLYVVLVGIYAFLVLRFMGGWLFHLFTAERKLYAVVALALIIGQGYVLELLSRSLLGLIKGKKEK